MQTLRPLTILTGASRGLGAAIAEQLSQRGAALLTMSRHPDQALSARATETGAPLEQWAIDLADGVSASTRLEAWLTSRSERLFIGDLDQQRGARRQGRTDRRKRRSRTCRGTARGTRGTDAVDASVFARDARLAYSAQSSEHFVRRWQEAVERHRGVLRRQGGLRSLFARGRTRRSSRAEQCDDRLAGTRRHRYRHADRVARVRSACVSKSAVALLR